MNDFTCNICATELTTEQIQIEKKYKIDVAYVICPECDNRLNLAFDNKQAIKIKRKIKQLKEIENYLKLTLYREMLLAEDTYYKNAFNDLPADEQKMIGEYVSQVDKQKIKEYNAAIKSKGYTIKDLVRLL